MSERVLTWSLIAVLGTACMWPRPHIYAEQHATGYSVKAVCPKGFHNGVEWKTLDNATSDQQWAEYVNDAGKAKCLLGSQVESRTIEER